MDAESLRGTVHQTERQKQKGAEMIKELFGLITFDAVLLVLLLHIFFAILEGLHSL